MISHVTRFRTVAKCGNGHDDATLNRLQTELEVVKISKVSILISIMTPEMRTPLYTVEPLYSNPLKRGHLCIQWNSSIPTA